LLLAEELLLPNSSKLVDVLGERGWPFLAARYPETNLGVTFLDKDVRLSWLFWARFHRSTRKGRKLDFDNESGKNAVSNLRLV
jgi:hypothetical protein